MLTIQKKGLVCFMGFAILSIFNMNNSIASDSFHSKQSIDNKVTLK